MLLTKATLLPLVMLVLLRNAATAFVVQPSAVAARFTTSATSSALRAGGSSASSPFAVFESMFSTTSGSASPTVVGVTGSTGLVGKLLLSSLADKGYEPHPLSRSPSDPDIFDASEVDKCDVIVHLAGENIASGTGFPNSILGLRPWTDEKMKEIIDSRVSTTEALAALMKKGANPLRKRALICASGVGIYGSKDVGPSATAKDEKSPIDAGDPTLLAEVSRKWESAAASAKSLSTRVVSLRFGVILDKSGGVLAKLFLPFFFGAGGNVGSGEQWFGYVSGRDAVRAIEHVIETSSLSGPVNVVAPTPTTNAGLTKALGGALNRPTIVPHPAFVVSLLFGQMG